MHDNVSTHPKWNYEEFLSFLLLYSAHADMEYDKSEREYILNRIDPEHYKEVVHEFEDLSDYEVLKIIEQYRGLYFPTASRRDELLDRIKAIFEIDGEFSIVEQNMYRMLKKIL